MIDGMKLSVVCGLKDRAGHLWKSLESWLARDEIDEVVIVDWSSSEPVVCGEPRVVVARAEGQDHWVASRCHNLGLHMAIGHLILRLDADDLLFPDFFTMHPFRRDEIPPFYYAELTRARDDNETHLAGVVYARRCDFLAVGGYNERIEIYGYEDTDLADRLAKRIAERCVDPITLADIDGRPFLIKLRDAAARLTLPYI